MYNEQLEKLIQTALADGVITDKQRKILIKKAKSFGIDGDEFEMELENRLAQWNVEYKAKPQPQDLDYLITEYLADGIISSKEREVLLRKAQQMGIDKDEMNLYIDAQQQKFDQKEEAAKNKRKGKICPYCGSSIPELSEKCPQCGENITVEASSELEDVLEHLESALVDFKSGEDIKRNKAAVERYMRKAKLYFGNNPKIQRLVAEIEGESLSAEKTAKRNEVKRVLVGILTYNKKLTAAIVVALLVGAFWGIFAPRSAEDIFKEQTEHVTSLIKSGNLAEADAYLVNLTNPNPKRISMMEYDPSYLAVINEYLKNGDLDSAEKLALVLKSKIFNDLIWENTSCYTLLKSKFEEAGKDFSALKSEYDYD